MSLRKIALIPDLHCSDHNERAINLACKVLPDVAPDEIIFLGDVLDFAWANHYGIDGSKVTGQFQRERNAWRKVAHQLIKAAGYPKRRRVMQGNHEHRFQREFLWKKPAFVDFEGAKWSEILYCKELGIEWVPSSEIWLAGGHFLCAHGKVVRKHSAYSAKGEFDDRGMSGCSGHTHRMGQFFITHTATEKVYSWTECGSLCNNPAHYRKPNEGRTNSQLGFAVMAANNTEYRTPTLIPFWPGKNGKLRARYESKDYSV